MFLFSPLEQFQILPVIPIRFFFDFSITNGTIIFFFSFLAFAYFVFQSMELLARFFAFEAPITIAESSDYFKTIKDVAHSFRWPAKR